MHPSTIVYSTDRYVGMDHFSYSVNQKLAEKRMADFQFSGYLFQYRGKPIVLDSGNQSYARKAFASLWQYGHAKNYANIRPKQEK